MPITCSLKLSDLTKPEFDEIDRIVIRCAYASQNMLGRLHDEEVYRSDIALRLRAEGMKVHTETPINVSFGTFEKIYRCDLIAADALYELKAAAAFNGEHDMQALHYAMMLNVGHVKLLNLRPPKVQGRLQFNALSTADRHAIVWDETKWRPLSTHCGELKQHARNIITDWGAYLDSRLYNEALLHFMGGEQECTRRVPVIRDGYDLGTRRLQFHASGIFFVVTAMTADTAAFESHLRKLMNHTESRGVQWLNLNHRCIQFLTLEMEATK